MLLAIISKCFFLENGVVLAQTPQHHDSVSGFSRNFGIFELLTITYVSQSFGAGEPLCSLASVAPSPSSIWMISIVCHALKK